MTGLDPASDRIQASTGGLCITMTGLDTASDRIQASTGGL